MSEQKQPPELEVILQKIEDLSNKLDTSTRFQTVFSRFEQVFRGLEQLSKKIDHVLEHNTQQQHLHRVSSQSQIEQINHFQEQMQHIHRNYAEQNFNTIQMLGQVIFEAVQKKETHIQRHEIDENAMNTISQLAKDMLMGHQNPVEVPTPPKAPDPFLSAGVLLENCISGDMDPSDLWRNLPSSLQTILMKLDRKDINAILETFFDSKVLNGPLGQEWLDGFCLFLEALQTNAATPENPFDQE